MPWETGRRACEMAMLLMLVGWLFGDVGESLAERGGQVRLISE